jgi:16S rRNA G966 N2-methylase RsmD
VRLDVFKFIRRHAHPIPPPSATGEGAFDFIYVAPPQYKELWAETLAALDQSALLAERGIIVAQIHPKEYKELALTQLDLFDQRKYGSTLLCFYRRRLAQ